MKNTSFDDRKMDLIEVASLGAFYSCEQCATIMSIFSFGDKKLAALRLMAPRIADPHRAYIIFDQLSFVPLGSSQWLIMIRSLCPYLIPCHCAFHRCEYV